MDEGAELVEVVWLADSCDFVLDVAGKSIVELVAEGSIAPVDFEGELLKADNVFSNFLVITHFEPLLSSCLNVTLELFGYSELSGLWRYRSWSDVRTDFGFSFDAAPTIDTVLYFGVSEWSEMNEDKIEIAR